MQYNPAAKKDHPEEKIGSNASLSCKKIFVFSRVPGTDMIFRL